MTGLSDGDEGRMVSPGRCVLLNVQPALMAPHPSVEKRAGSSVRQHIGTCFAPRERWLEVTATCLLGSLLTQCQASHTKC